MNDALQNIQAARQHHLLMGIRNGIWALTMVGLMLVIELWSIIK